MTRPYAPASPAWMKRSAEQLCDKYLATGMVTVEDLARYERFAQDPQAWGIHDATVAVTGRKSS